jgi:hypothetical protein
MAEYYRDVMPPNEAFETHRFPSRVPYFTLIIMGMVAVFLIVLLVIAWRFIEPNRPLPTGVILGSLGGLVFYSLVFTILYAIFDRYFPLRAGPGGLCSYNGFGMNTRVRWQDIRDVKRIPVGPGIAYLLILEKRPLSASAWVPLYIKDLPGFAECVTGYAGPENPLSQFLIAKK